jgi:peroxiredoxin
VLATIDRCGNSEGTSQEGYIVDGREVEVGTPAPDFSLDSSEGHEIHLSDYRDRQHVTLYFMREFT